jgi:DNA-binding SARP family transcriptional activator
MEVESVHISIGVRMEFRILGPVEVLDGGRPIPLASPKHRTLLAILLLNANQVVATDRLVDLLWPDGPPTTATNLLHGYVAKVRRLLHPGAVSAAASILLTRPPGYLLRVGDGELDLHRFEHLLAEAEDAMRQRAFQAAAARLGVALALWRGPALADLPAVGLRQAEGARLEELHLTALERRVDADLALGRHDCLVAELTALSATYPLRERVRGQADAGPLPLGPAGGGAASIPGVPGHARRGARHRAHPRAATPAARDPGGRP